MPPLVPTRFDNKVSRLRDRLDKPGAQPKVRNKLQKFQTKQYNAQQANRPPTPTPWSAKYETTVGSLGNQLNQTNAQLTGQELATKQQYGFEDNSNPFASARMLERNFAQQQNRTGNSYAAQGQLYSGALSRARGADQFDFSRNLDTMSREYQTQLAGIATDRLGAQTQYDEGIAAAEAQRLEDALNAPVDPMEAGATPGFVNKYKNRLQGNLKKAKKNDQNKRVKAIRKRLKNI